MSLPGVRPSPNIWQHPEVYEAENLAFDRDAVLETAMVELLGRELDAGFAGLRVLDVGCGSGFHLPLFSRTALSVVGVEPHPPLVSLARRRTRRLANVRVLAGTAQQLPVPTASVDVTHARWAYFFGPGCEPGLRELERVAAPGATSFVIDNDASRSTFGRWFQTSVPDHDQGRVEDFWARRGWQSQSVLTSWQFDSWRDLEAVLRIELTGEAADAAVAELQSQVPPPLTVDYAVMLRWRHW